MTIGIVACGKNAGTALVTVLGSIEHVAEGAIGGFVSLVVMDVHNKATFYECQSGGITALFGNSNGVVSVKTLPTEILEATRAGLISSGPHRPSPLARFLSWDENGNIVTGHRFPQSPTADGTPLNQRVLSVMQKKGTNPALLSTVMLNNDGLDAGILALDANNNLYCEDTQRVRNRTDTASGEMQTEDFTFGFSMNSIYPKNLIADLLTSKLADKLSVDIASKQTPRIFLNKELLILAGSSARVEVNTDHQVLSVITPEPCWFEDRSEGALMETGTPIVLNGIPLGTTFEEAYVLASQGKIISLSGQDELALQYLKCE